MSSNVEVTLLQHQADFIFSEALYPAIVGGLRIWQE